MVDEFIPMSSIGSNRREPMEFEWTNFAGFTTLQIFAEIQNMMTETQCEPKQFPGRIKFMSVYNDIVWGAKGNREACIANSHMVADYARKFARVIGRFLGPDRKRSGMELIHTNRMENGTMSLRS